MGIYKEIVSIIFITLFIFSLIVLAAVVVSSLLLGIITISFKYLAAMLFI